MNLRKEFISSYQGCADYMIGGNRYECRFFGDDFGQYMPEVYDREILPCVGSVKKFAGSEYPSDEVMALFPGYVGCRYNAKLNVMEFQSPPAVELWRGEIVMAKAYADEMRGMYEQ